MRKDRARSNVEVRVAQFTDSLPRGATSRRRSHDDSTGQISFSTSEVELD